MRVGKPHIFLCIAAVALATAACGSRRNTVALSNRQLGLAKLNEGNAEGAVADLTQSYKLNPDDPETVHYLGMAYWSKGRLLGDAELKIEGVKYILESLEMDSRPDWQNNLCALYVDIGRFEDARKYCELAVKDPGYRTPERALNNIGKSYLEEERYDDALTALERALRVQPRSCQALWNKGVALQGLKRWDKALRALNKVNNICPEYPEPYLVKAKVLWFGKRDANAAVAALKKAQALTPDGPVGEEAAELLQLIEKK